MKLREQALLLLGKAAQDEALPDQVLTSEKVSDEMTPVGAVYRYEDYDSELPLDRQQARTMVQSLRAWVDSRLNERSPQEP